MSASSYKPCSETMTNEELEALLEARKIRQLGLEVRLEVKQKGDEVDTEADDKESDTLAQLLKRDPSLSLEQHAMMIFCSFARGVNSCGGSFQTFLTDLPNLKKLLIAYGALDVN